MISSACHSLNFTGDLFSTVKDNREDRRAGFVDSLLNADKAGSPVKAENPVISEHQKETHAPDEDASSTNDDTQSKYKTASVFNCMCF